uniref:Endonuclease/exonuclease/phosphatase domain-containing protein n=1 Tax=Arcella intermedia TaxID=1963864 RepID=A0A6B2LF77_9EUKA
MLADWLSDAFPFAKPEVLKWDYRKNKIIQVVLEVNPDVFALEECDHYEDWFKGQFKAKGYKSTYLIKNGGNDGTAIFWKKEKFTKLKQGTHTYLWNSKKTTQGVLAVVLQGKDKEKTSICVAATHLKAKPGFEEQRKGQGEQLVQYIKEFNEKQSPVVILGDFNDTPDSLVCKHMGLHYASAYPSNTWTTWKKRETVVQRTIDYIWYDSAKLQPIQILPAPLESDCPQLLPASYYPSDHILIAAKFILKSKL